MAKKRKKNRDDLGPVDRDNIQVRKCGPIIIPLPLDNPESHRYATWVREGRLSGEIFCKNPERRAELGLPALIVET